ncbi:MAG: NapC/NirT family cytochrome c [Gammaproteobacteria bacterium]|jgi:cytochrome c-type protein NapC|nr:NapC/NirT family cytochrome c [Gammaproteobacteria bacterium]MBP6050618.1 NapC/NirT family cytochrome c [Pseudomonadales bacterium]MBK6583465.1 NapC/NirT family cytochrome c [Gammaproteobacteria bacterium]MBK7168918.1 NapC/NirT family cytochrome c [Gammaproteobacteria bacterium]MBK7521071.1 NapC/NirT family cytochrome c [Gammaproteobacteria bacterium]
MPTESAGPARAPRRLIAVVLALGVVIGIVGVAVFNFSLAATSTDEFCLGCHNHAIPYARHQLTVHYKNEFGVVPGCSDCHVQHDFLPKMQRKMEAAREVWGHFRGVIDTDEKYLAHQPEMKERELARFRSSDSATCRSCHNVERMDLEAQSPKARRDHAKLGQGKTCVDCHEDAGHAVASEEASKSGDSFDF